MVVVTHRVPGEWANREGSPFTFVTEGVPEAIDVAREIAGDKDVSGAVLDVIVDIRAGSPVSR